VNTTLEIEDELFRQAKARAALEGKRLRDLVEEGLRLVLEQTNARSHRRRRVQLPLIKACGHSGIDLTSADLAALELREDEQRHAPSL
jgi:hypothetical protein